MAQKDRMTKVRRRMSDGFSGGGSFRVEALVFASSGSFTSTDVGFKLPLRSAMLASRFIALSPLCVGAATAAQGVMTCSLETVSRSKIR